ncbi:hypothetical protein [Frankia sp. AvcI1]|uniref:hypothetical protein n=1 Tax=Frankia sp. AvcI1 TaxID=573496 RepID=UPI000AE78A39|nr:hypothetical protein [Frankia sp. AvcI1]
MKKGEPPVPLGIDERFGSARPDTRVPGAQEGFGVAVQGSSGPARAAVAVT